MSKARHRMAVQQIGQIRHRNQNKRRQSGFSIPEFLATVMILMLASAIVASGVPVARGAINKVVDSANAQALLSTVTTVLRDEISMATKVEVKNSGAAVSDGTFGNEIDYLNDMTGERALTFDKVLEDDPTRAGKKALDISTGMTGKGQYEVYFTNVKKDGEVITFTDLRVLRKDDGLELAKTPTYQVRMLNIH